MVYISSPHLWTSVQCSMKDIVTPQYYAVNGAVMSINQDNLDRPGPGPGPEHNRNWIWTCQELDLNMP